MKNIPLKELTKLELIKARHDAKQLMNDYLSAHSQSGNAKANGQRVRIKWIDYYIKVQDRINKRIKEANDVKNITSLSFASRLMRRWGFK